jgi:hypothetical protein
MIRCDEKGCRALFVALRKTGPIESNDQPHSASIERK